MQLRGLLDQFLEKISDRCKEDRIENLKDLFAAGEEHLAIESLCEEIPDWEKGISQQEFEKFKYIAEHFRIDGRFILALNGHIKNALEN